MNKKIVSSLVMGAFFFSAHAIDNQIKEKKMLRVAINGFGRIGRNFLRGVLKDKNAQEHIKVVAINLGPAKREFAAHMFKYDTLMGTFDADIRLENSELVVDDYRIQLMNVMDPAKTGWSELGIDWVVECTGCFTHRDGAAKHLAGGAKHVLISAPAKDEDISIVPGVNLSAFDAEKHKIVSLGSCTTNAFITMLKVLHENFLIDCGFMTTVHAYTNTQVLLDVETNDLRRSRAAALNIIPTSTGAAKMLTKLLPELDGKVFAKALRVPVGKVSLIDLTITTEKNMSVDAIHAAFAQSMQGSMKNIIGMTDEPLVSSDFSCNDNSVTIDTLLTEAHNNTAKIFGWYDNEWGYSMRLKDFLVYAAQN